MMYLIAVVYGILFAYLLLRKDKKPSTLMLPPLFFSMLSSVALSQNYTQSLIPEANDGISISNFLARFLISEDRWTQELFSSYFQWSLVIVLLLIVGYLILLTFEKTKRE